MEKNPDYNKSNTDEMSGSIGDINTKLCQNKCFLHKDMAFQTKKNKSQNVLCKCQRKRCF